MAAFGFPTPNNSRNALATSSLRGLEVPAATGTSLASLNPNFAACLQTSPEGPFFAWPSAGSVSIEVESTLPANRTLRRLNIAFPSRALTFELTQNALLMREARTLRVMPSPYQLVRQTLRGKINQGARRDHTRNRKAEFCLVNSSKAIMWLTGKIKKSRPLLPTKDTKRADVDFSETRGAPDGSSTRLRALVLTRIAFR